MRHKHADLIHAWADGAEIEWLCGDDIWLPITYPNWHEDREYRIKPKEPEWFENIPEHGVLCWVSSDDKQPDSSNFIRRVFRHTRECRFAAEGCGVWSFATPLTDDEIRQFLRGEE